MADGIRVGNIKLVLCFLFYLTWWIMGFNPKHPIRGIKSGWLLIPAAALGIWALIDIFRGIDFAHGPLPGVVFVVGGILSYVALLTITGILLHRPVTSELLIIVLWVTVALLEINTLMAVGSVSMGLGWILMALCLLCTAVSLVCYQLFYGLDARAAFIDGAIPLILAGAMTGIVALCVR